MDLDIFREYITLTSHRSFTSAARELNMSQPSLSRHISAFEKALAHELFYDSQPLSLTASGEVVLEYAARIVSEYENMQNDLKRIGSSSDRILIQDLLYANTLFYGIKEALEEVKKQYPSTRGEFVTLSDGKDLEESLKTGKTDIVFDFFISTDIHYAPSYPDSIKHMWVPEFHGELCIAAPKGSPLANKADLGLKDCEYLTFACRNKKSEENFRNSFIYICEQEGFRPRINLKSADSDLSFYSDSSDNNALLLTRLNHGYPSLIAPLIKANYDILYLKNKKYYVNGYVLMRATPRSASLSLVADLLEKRALKFLDDNSPDT